MCGGHKRVKAEMFVKYKDDILQTLSIENGEEWKKEKEGHASQT